MAREKYYVVTASSLNIRSGPGIDYEILGSAEKDEKIISPNTKNWVPIVLDDDTIGWMAENYLKKVSKGKPELQEKPAPAGSKVDFPLFQEDLTDLFGVPNYDLFTRKNLINIEKSN